MSLTSLARNNALAALGCTLSDALALVQLNTMSSFSFPEGFKGCLKVFNMMMGGAIIEFKSVNPNAPPQWGWIRHGKFVRTKDMPKGCFRVVVMGHPAQVNPDGVVLTAEELFKCVAGIAHGVLTIGGKTHEGHGAVKVNGTFVRFATPEGSDERAAEGKGLIGIAVHNLDENLADAKVVPVELALAMAGIVPLPLVEWRGDRLVKNIFEPYFNRLEFQSEVPYMACASECDQLTPLSRWFPQRAVAFLGRLGLGGDVPEATIVRPTSVWAGDPSRPLKPTERWEVIVPVSTLTALILGMVGGTHEERVQLTAFLCTSIAGGHDELILRLISKTDAMGAQVSVMLEDAHFEMETIANLVAHPDIRKAAKMEELYPLSAGIVGMAVRCLALARTGAAKLTSVLNPDGSRTFSPKGARTATRPTHPHTPQRRPTAAHGCAPRPNPPCPHRAMG